MKRTDLVVWAAVFEESGESDKIDRLSHLTAIVAQEGCRQLVVRFEAEVVNSLKTWAKIRDRGPHITGMESSPAPGRGAPCWLAPDEGDLVSYVACAGMAPIARVASSILLALALFRPQ